MKAFLLSSIFTSVRGSVVPSLLLGGLGALAGRGFAEESPLVGSFYVQEYSVIGANTLNEAEVSDAVYPFLGPARTADDVEKARAALEKAYHDKGFQTVSVEIPAQNPQGGIVLLQVNEAKVGRLRVKGSRYFSLADIKRHVPSLAEGKLPNFNDVSHDLSALNQLPDRRISPDLKPGVEPGTVDIDLQVKDTLPLHGSVELNNRHSADTTKLRLSGSLSYNNLWQLGHSIGASFQIAPEHLDDSKIYSAFYQVRFPNVPWFSLMFSATKQESDVATLGGSTTLGAGNIFGARALITLPGAKDFFHSLSFGVDYKDMKEEITTIDLADGVQIALLKQYPIQYYPLSAVYDATWTGKGSATALSAGVHFHHRGLGSDPREFDNKRYKATGSYIYLRGDLSHTQELPGGFQLFGKVQGQAANQPLINTEQFAGGGLDTVRGYLEAAAVGDNALFGTIELRTPSLLGWWDKDGKESSWRLYTFLDGGYLTINQPLPEQTSRFDLASYGVGSSLDLWDHVHGSVDLAVPLISREGTSLFGPAQTLAHDPHVTFRVWADF